jgi:hypothetical protein
LALITLNRKISRSELRWFAGLWFPAFCALAGAIAYRKFDSPEAAVLIWSVGGLLSIVGFFLGAVIRPCYIALLWITFPVGWLVSHVLLLAMYFLVITPIGFLVRRISSPLELRFDRSASSYWTEHKESDLQRYFRQF